MESEFSKDWKIYVDGYLNKRIISYLDDRFKQRGITKPKIQHIKEITLDEALNSRYPISEASAQELMLFVQELNKQ